MIKEYKIYKLIDPVSKEVRYIGYTSGTLENRLRYHIYDCNKLNTHKCNWIKSLLKKDLKPIIETICICFDLNDALQKEVFYISKYSNLTNSTTGGETNKVYRADVIKKMSDNRKGKYTGSDNHKFGIKDLALSERNKTRVWKDGSKHKLSVDKKALYNTPKYKEIHTNSQTTKVSIKALKDGLVIGCYPSKRRMAEDLNLDRKSIQMVLNGKHSQHKGYTFSLT